MNIQRLLITVSAVALLVGAAASPVGARSASYRTPVTFSGAVELPGLTLPAGTYFFERANPESGDVVVLVRSQRGNLQWLGLTNRAERRRGDEGMVQLSEAARGEAPRVLTWFPAGSSVGSAFIY